MADGACAKPQQRRRRPRLPPAAGALLAAALLLAAAAAPRPAAAVRTAPPEPGKGDGSGGTAGGFLAVASIPGCGGGSGRALSPELAACAWSVQMQRGASRWYAFEVAPDTADNMSVVVMARAVSGQITMALWGPGSDPYRSVPTQVGTNYMDTPGLREEGQDSAAAGGGHRSIASEQQHLFLARREDRPLLSGQYVMVVQADMGQPLVQVEISTPSSMTQLVAEEQEALKELVGACCPGLPRAASEQPPADVSGWCGSVGRAVTYDLRQWFSDICHVAPNLCDRDGHLVRLALPPYSLRCPEFPKALGKFTRLRHIDLSYSSAGGTIADVADVAARLPQLEQLHIRGIGLRGPLGCELVKAARSLKSLSLSDNDKLSGSLPPCWLGSNTLQELQLAGLSGLGGPLPAVPPAGDAGGGARRLQGSSSSSSSGPCGFGRLKYVNMAGVIGDQEPGLTGALPQSLGFCEDLAYLDLSGHGLSGSLPPLPRGLQFLNLSSNGLSGQLPDFAASGELQYVDLSFNRLTGELQDMTSLPKLDWLDLSDNALRGGLPPLPPSVRWVDLSNNQLDGELRLTVQQPPRGREGQQAAEVLLVLLNLGHNKLTGALSGSLASAPHLSFLDLSFNILNGTLEEFARALPPRNQLLQVNLSHNRLSGGLPDQLQALAAVRPVMVTMKDGYTPVHRILDLSHNELQGAFPPWLITALPALLQSCQCTAGVALDAQRFTCPQALPELSRKAQDVLHSFEALQCQQLSADGSKSQQVPVWQLAGPSYTAASREQHKQMLEAQAPGRRRCLAPGAIAGIVVGCVAGAALLAGAALSLAMGRRRRGLLSSQSVDALLHSYDPYQPAGDAPLGAGPSFGSASGGSSGGGSPTSSRGSRSSSSGDGVCEIALVCKGNASGAFGGGAAAGRPAGRDLSKDGVV